MRPMVLRPVAAAATFAALAFSAIALAQTPETQPPVTKPATAADPYIWLEDMRGPKAMAWVEKQNARSLALLKGDARYARYHQDALTIVNATDRIPYPGLIGKDVYNFWQDPTNVRGLWRRTTQASYATPNPQWETVLDLDALSKAENANWIWKGANCPPPKYTRCMVALSNGGEDATEEREFDLTTKSFVPGGFRLPHSKQGVDWLDDDTLILNRDWGPGTLTESGYGFIVKTLKRGQPLDAAQEVFRGKVTDVSVGASVLHDAAGHKVALIQRATDFFHTETYLLGAHGVVRLALPEKVTVQGLIDGRLVFSIEQDWSFGGQAYKAGTLLAATPEALSPGGTGGAELLFEPGPRQSVEQVAITAGRVVAAVYDNVRGGLMVFQPTAQGWKRTSLPVAANSSVGVVAASDLDDTIYYNVEGFLDPARLWQANAATGAHRDIKALPARFDASKDAVDQYEATSSDGTKVPYFVVHPKTMKLDGSNPTLLYAYGGFQVSELPSYSPMVGKLWLEQGGV
ncbi:MAG TPA: S9 family peptidase, partial [Caulobacteraceae bacterium]|nr:S9 family peptidase [Caulobacteraceae bacterium]